MQLALMPDLARPTVAGTDPAHALDARGAVLPQFGVALVLRNRDWTQIFDAVVELIAINVIQHRNGIVAVHDPN